MARVKVSQCGIHGEDIEGVEGAFPNEDPQETLPKRDLQSAGDIDDEVGGYHREETPTNDDGEFFSVQGRPHSLRLHRILGFEGVPEAQKASKMENDGGGSEDAHQVQGVGQGRIEKEHPCDGKGGGGYERKAQDREKQKVERDYEESVIVNDSPDPVYIDAVLVGQVQGENQGHHHQPGEECLLFETGSLLFHPFPFALAKSVSCISFLQVGPQGSVRPAHLPTYNVVNGEGVENPHTDSFRLGCGRVCPCSR